MKREICLSGSGGQGVVLAGIILAVAAMKDNKNVVQTQSYGPELRGGASKAEVIIASDEIDYPKVLEADIILAMTQEASDKYVEALLKDGGIVILDSTFVSRLPDKKAEIYSLPITQIARKEIGKTIVANMVALGALVGITNVVTLGSLEKSIIERSPGGTQEINTKALSLGYEAALTASPCI